jgi:hypothetical protein
MFIADSYIIGGNKTIKKNSEKPYSIILTISNIYPLFKTYPDKIPLYFFKYMMIYYEIKEFFIYLFILPKSVVIVVDCKKENLLNLYFK